MQAIEFEATPFQHTIRIPDCVPDGVSLRVLLLVDEQNIENNNTENIRWKNLLGSMPNVGSDEDFARSLDYGREISWGS
jgi:hypothetical protein